MLVTQEPINIMVALKLYELHPNLTTIAIQDEVTSKWSAAICEFNPITKQIGATVYSLDTYIYNTEYKAVAVMGEMIDRAFDMVTRMAN